MNIEWHYIMDKQPEHMEEIIQCDRPYQGHYTLGMRKYYQTLTFDKFLAESRSLGFNDPDFYWTSAKDFPFPVFKEKDKE